MNPAMLRLMKAKKKRPVDPNAPPRPNLLSHEKTLKDQKQTVAHMQYRLDQLQAQVESISSKLHYQTKYLEQLHQQIFSRKKGWPVIHLNVQ